VKKKGTVKTIAGRVAELERRVEEAEEIQRQALQCSLKTTDNMNSIVDAVIKNKKRIRNLAILAFITASACFVLTLVVFLK